MLWKVKILFEKSILIWILLLLSVHKLFVNSPIFIFSFYLCVCCWTFLFRLIFRCLSIWNYACEYLSLCLSLPISHSLNLFYFLLFLLLSLKLYIIFTLFLHILWLYSISSCFWFFLLIFILHSPFSHRSATVPSHSSNCPLPQGDQNNFSN